MARLVLRLAAAILIAAVMAVPVIAVAVAAGNPIPADLLQRLTARNMNDTTILKILSICFYVCWAWFCGPTLRLLLTTATRRPSRPAQPSASERPAALTVESGGAGARGWLVRLTRFAISGAATATTLVGVAPLSVAAAGPSTAAAAATAPDTTAATVAAAPGHVENVAASVAASHRDTPYAIARRLVPADQVDAVRDEILELNVGRVLPDGSTYRGGGFPYGWQVLVPAIADPAPQEHATAEPSDAALPPADGATPVGHVVGADESYWSIAEDQLRVELGREPAPAETLVRTTALIAHNAPRLGYDDPAMLHPGDVVEPAPTPPSATDGATLVGHVVGADESYWSIAEDQLRVELGREPAPAETLERTNALIAHNAPRLGYDDPTLLRVGDIVEPTVHADRPDVPSLPPAPAEADEPGAGRPATAPETTSSRADDGADDRRAAETTPANAAPPVTPRTPPPAPTTGSVPASSPRELVPAHADRGVVELGTATAVSSRGPLPSARWLFGSAAVSTLGLVGGWMTLRRLQLRRHRWAIGCTAARSEPVAALDVAAEGDPLIGRQVEFLAALSTSGPPTIPVRAVLMNTVAVEVLFVDPVDALPDGWQPDPAVNGWIHPFEDGAVDALGWLSPATATLGHRSDPGDCEIMLDLRSAGRLAITGDELRVRSLMCSLAWELSASAMGRHVDVYLIGFACSSAQMTARPARRVTVTEAAELAATAPGDGEPPRVFFIDGYDTAAAVSELIDGCEPGSGNAVVLPVPFDAALETVHVPAQGRTEWAGFTLEPYGVHPSADGELASTLSAIHIGRLHHDATATIGARASAGGGDPADPIATADRGPAGELDDGADNGPDDPGDGPGGDLGAAAPVPGWASSGADARVVLRTCGTPAVQGAPSSSSLAVVFLLAEGGRTMHGTEIGELTGYKPKTLSTVFTNESPLLERCDGTLTAAQHVITDHRLLAEQAAAVRAAAAAGTARAADVSLLVDGLAEIDSAPYGRLPGGKAHRSWGWVDDYPEDVPARAAAERNIVSAALDIAAARITVDAIGEPDRSVLVEELCRLARLIPYATVAAPRRVDTSGRCLIRSAYETAGNDVTLRDKVVMHARRLVAAGLLEDPGDELADFLEL